MQIMPPVKSGISELDELTGGFFPGELTIVGARFEIGKTTFIVSVIKNLIMKHNVKPVLFSMDLGSFSIKRKLVAMISGVSSGAYRIGRVKNLDSRNRARQIILSSDFVCDWFDTIKIDELCDKVRKCVLENEQNQTIIFIEYYHHISTDDYKRPYCERRAEIIMKLKALAQELSVPIICTVQFRRHPINPEPNLEELRKCYGLLTEENADVVIFIHKEKNQNDYNGIFSRELIVAKNKSSKTGRCTFSIPCF